jgi:uncharacterized membrane protein YgdD (TMEM256/DUF423 family)
MERLWIGFGALFGLTAVAMQAYIAHGTKGVAAASLVSLHSAADTQMWHALALVATGAWGGRGRKRLVNWAGLAFVVGIALFCGAIYAQVLRGLHLPNLAPTGGFVLMGGWLLLLLSAVRR